jgi:hypothetical protein
MSPA